MLKQPQNNKKPLPGQMKEIFTWDKDRINLVVADYEDLDEAMKERAAGVSIYDMLERYGDAELIPGYGASTVKRKDGELNNQADLDLSSIPEFGTDLRNAEIAAAEARLADELKKAEEAKKAAEEARKKAEEAAKAREEAINNLLKQSEGGK